MCLRVLLLRGHECHKVCQVTARVLGLDEETVGELRWLCRGGEGKGVTLFIELLCITIILYICWKLRNEEVNLLETI